MVTGIDSLTFDVSLLVYRNTDDFCVLVLYCATLLIIIISLISSSNFLVVVSLGLSVYSVMTRKTPSYRLS